MRERLEWCSARLQAVLLYGSHAAYRCLRLIGAIYAVDSDAEMVAGCSNTTRDEVQRTLGFAILVS